MTYPFDRRQPLSLRRVARRASKLGAMPSSPVYPLSTPSSAYLVILIAVSVGNAPLSRTWGGWVPLVAGRPGLWGTWPADRR